jgi:hypothetical protein
VSHPFAFAEAALAEDYSQADDLPLRFEYTWQHRNRGRHAELALREGAMHCIDPMNGERLRATRAQVLPGEWASIVYHFEGQERFALVTSSFDQAKVALYFPERDVFIPGDVDENWVNIGRAAIDAMLQHEAQAQGRPWDGPAGAVLHLGFNNNLGHFMWNDLSGLEAAIDAGMLKHIGTVVCGPHCPFPVEALFPELAAAGVPVQHWRKPLPPLVDHGADSLPLRLAGNRIQRSLRRRIVAWALQAEAQNLASLAELNRPGLNLWCNLRLHNKAWVDQVEGIYGLAHSMAKALSRVKPAGRTLHLLLDGTPDTTVLVTQLAEFLEGTATVTDATRIPLSRTIAMCGLVDLHLCVIGSGLTLPHWVMGRRGVAHSNHPHLGQQRFWNNVAEGAHDVVFVPRSAINDLDAPLTPDPSYVNYQLDALAVLPLLDALYRQCDSGPRRSGFQQALHLAAQGRFTDAADRLISV